MVTAPSTGAIVSPLPLHKTGVGSASVDTTRQLGGGLGVAVVGNSVASLYRRDIVHRLVGRPAGPQAASGSRGRRSRPGRLPGSDGRALLSAARQSYGPAFALTIGVTVVVSLAASALVAWLLRPVPEAATADAAMVLEAA